MSPEIKRRVRRPDIALGITDLNLEMLRLIALGLSRPEIAERLGSTKHGVDQALFNSYSNLTTHGEVHTILTLIDRGVLNLDEFTAGFDLSKFDLLKSYHHKVLKKMVEDNGSGSYIKSIGRNLRNRVGSVSQRMAEIHTITGEFSRPRIALLYVAYQRQQGQHAMSENGGVVFSPKPPLTAAK